MSRSQVPADSGGSTQTERSDSSVIDQTLLSLQTKLQQLELKQAAFVTRCISILKERKLLLSSRLSGEGGVVDDGFRREICELSKEKDRIEEDIQYMLDLKENSHRRPQSSSGKALIDAMRAAERLCLSAKERLLAAVFDADAEATIAEVVDTLLKGTQSVVMHLNAERSRQNEEFVGEIKHLQSENQTLERRLKEKMMEGASEAQAQLRRENAELERQNRQLTEKLSTIASAPGSPAGFDQVPVEAVSLRQTPVSSQSQRRLPKESDLLRTWKHAAPAAQMQELRGELATCTERFRALRAFFAEKLDSLQTAAHAFLCATEHMTGKREQVPAVQYERAKAELAFCLDTINLPLSETMEATGRRSTQSWEDGEYRKKSEMLVLENQKLQQGLETQTRQQRELIQDCMEMKAEISQLKDASSVLEREKKALSVRVSSEKVAKERLREEVNRRKIAAYETQAVVKRTVEEVTIGMMDIDSKCSQVSEYLLRVKHCSDAARGLKRRILAARQSAAQAKNSYKTHIVTLQTLVRSKESENTHLQSQLQHQINAKSREVADLGNENERLQGEVRKSEGARETLVGKIASLEEELEAVVEYSKGLEEIMRKKEENPQKTHRESFVIGELEQIHTEINSQMVSFEGKFDLLDSFLKRISRFSSKLSQIYQRNKEKAAQLVAQAQYFQSELVSKQCEFSKAMQELQAELEKTREKFNFVSNSNRELEEAQRKTKAEYTGRIRLMENHMKESVESYEKRLQEEKGAITRQFSAENAADKSQMAVLRAEIQALNAEKTHSEQQFTAKIAEIRSECEIQIRTSSDKFRKDLERAQCELSDAQERVEKQRNSLSEYRNSLIACINCMCSDWELGSEVTVEAMIRRLKEAWSEKTAAFSSETDSIKRENSLLVQRIQEATLESEILRLQLERKTAEMEDYQSAFLLEKDAGPPTHRISLDSQSEWEQEREALLQKFAREKLELLASLEAENQFLKSKTAAVKPQIFLAEEQASDVEVQRLSASFEIAVDQAAGPNRAFHALFQAVNSYAEAEKVDIDEVISSVQQSLLTGKRAVAGLFSDRETQTENKYREFASYLSLEDEISAVEKGVCHGESLGRSFARVTDALFEGKELTPSFDISREHTPQQLSVCSPEQLHTEGDQAVVEHYRRLESDLEAEIRTGKLLQQQILLLNEEISQKDRQLERLSEARPQMNGEVIADAFGKLARTLPHL